MPDFPTITLCKGEGCLDRDNCFRYLATYDSAHFFEYPPYMKGKGYCVYFWRTTKEELKEEKIPVREDET